LGIEVKGPQDTLPFHPYYTVKDLFYLACFLILYAVFVFYAPNSLVDPANAIAANPIVTPEHIVPEWYLLPFYAILRSIPNKALGVLALFGALLTLFFIPWLDTSKVRSARFRPLFAKVFWLLVVDCVMLGYVGSQPVDAMLYAVPLVWLGRLGTLYYFVHFWILVPLIGLTETPKPMPASIAKAVLKTPAASRAPAGH
jgi:ubiquinol-cytochrome c reductase cytochrome b/c1 subunit